MGKASSPTKYTILITEEHEVEVTADLSPNLLTGLMETLAKGEVGDWSIYDLDPESRVASVEVKQP